MDLKNASKSVAVRIATLEHSSRFKLHQRTWIRLSYRFDNFPRPRVFPSSSSSLAVFAFALHPRERFRDTSARSIFLPGVNALTYCVRQLPLRLTQIDVTYNKMLAGDGSMCSWRRRSSRRYCKVQLIFSLTKVDSIIFPLSAAPGSWKVSIVLFWVVLDVRRIYTESG